MSANLPEHVKRALSIISYDETICEQCSTNVDPLYQDWRYNVICDTLKEFESRGISYIKLRKWVKKIGAIYPWNISYDIFRQIMNRRFVAFPWLIAMTTKVSQVRKALKIAVKYNIPFCIRVIIL